MAVKPTIDMKARFVHLHEATTDRDLYLDISMKDGFVAGAFIEWRNGPFAFRESFEEICAELVRANWAITEQHLALANYSAEMQREAAEAWLRAQNKQDKEARLRAEKDLE